MFLLKIKENYNDSELFNEGFYQKSIYKYTFYCILT